MASLIVLDSFEAAAAHGNIYHNAPNQIRRAIGRFSRVYVGERCGTVRDASGKCWDWTTSETELAAPGWPKIVIVPAV